MSWEAFGLPQRAVVVARGERVGGGEGGCQCGEEEGMEEVHCCGVVG